MGDAIYCIGQLVAVDHDLMQPRPKHVPDHSVVFTFTVKGETLVIAVPYSGATRAKRRLDNWTYKLKKTKGRR